MQNEIKIEYFKTPYGELILGSFENKLCLSDWRYRKMRISIDKRINAGLNAVFIEKETKVINETKTQLAQYFNGERTEFDIHLLLIGTDFQKSVWNALQQIPYGKTDTYLGLSKKLANEKAIRALANANGANAISIIIPCHRIIGSDGKLVGYASGLDVKRKLLSLENSLSKNQLSLFENLDPFLIFELINFRYLSNPDFLFVI
ncbi:methylated-DNA--[protein]-cysteine S-methyltransferase [Bacteroidota bacterium]